MRTIERNPPPVCLADQPPNQDWRTFMHSKCHAELHRSLRQEQRDLCCYCELGVAEDDGHIEHMAPQKHPGRRSARTYDYSNLAVSCNGGAVEHCGRYKDDRNKNPKYTWDATRFSLPHDPATSALLQYDIQGGVSATDVDVAKANYLIDYLNLDCSRLAERRKSHAILLVDTLGEQPGPDVVAWLCQAFLQPDATGRLKQFHSLSKAILEPWR